MSCEQVAYRLRSLPSFSAFSAVNPFDRRER
jgi:hypothetical protein